MLVTAEPARVLAVTEVAFKAAKVGVPVKVIVSPAASPNVTLPLKVASLVTANVPEIAVLPVAPKLTTVVPAALFKFKMLVLPPDES